MSLAHQLGEYVVDNDKLRALHSEAPDCGTQVLQVALVLQGRVMIVLQGRVMIVLQEL